MSTRTAAGRWRVLAASAGVAALALLLTAAVAALAPRPAAPPVPRGYAAIRIGMTEPDVEALLGGPRGVYGPGKGSHYKVVTAYGESPDGHASVWYFPGHDITVSFDPAGRVRGKHAGPPEAGAARAWRSCVEGARACWPW